MNRWLWVREQWRPYWIYGIGLVALTLVSTAVSVALPLFFKELIDRLMTGFAGLSPAEADSTRLRFILVLFGIGLLRFFGSLSPFFRAWMNHTFDRRLRERYFDSLLEKGPAFFIKYRTGDIVTRLTDDITGFPKVAWFCCSAIFRAINSGSIVLFGIITLFFIHPKLALITILPLPLGMLLFAMISQKLRKAYKLQQEAVSTSTNHLESCLSGVRILKAFDAEEREASRFRSVLLDRLNVEMKVVKLSGAMHIFFEFISYAAQVLVVLYGGLLVIDKDLTVGGYYAFFTILSMVVYPMIDLPTLLVTSRQAFVCVDRLEELRTDDPDGIQTSDGHELQTLQAIGCRDLEFKYGQDDENFHLGPVNLTLNRGETIAVVGTIGSGKTTLAQLLCGYQRPTAGEILVNGESFSHWDTQSVRGRIGVIPQEPLVFSETIGQNIRFWRDLPIAAVKESAHLSQFSVDIASFPDAYEQELGQRGVTLSGGQKQRLTIARALAGRPEMLVMDDVTASLDAENEERFWHEIERMFGKVTTVVVTHRAATARRADRVLVLDRGRVEAIGDYMSLMRSSSLFRRIMTGEEE